MHGIQSWIALPLEHEEIEPRFEHHGAAAHPRVVRDGATLEVLAGTAFGARSPASVLSPTLYVHARLDAGARLRVDEEHEERAVYVVEGAVRIGACTVDAGAMAVLRPGAAVVVEAQAPARLMIVGGAKLAGERHIDWNFVSSSKERLERARDDWRGERYPKVPGDEVERIPLPAR